MSGIASPKTIRLDSIYGEIETFEDDLITEQIRKFGGHTRPEFGFALSALDPSMNVFDIGAHIGTFSLAALRKMNPGAKLVSVEGSPSTFEILVRNLSSKQHDIFPVCAFVGSGEGMVYMEPEGNTGGGRLVKAQESAVHKAAKTTDIDRLSTEYFVPDYVKIDVEGAEYDALFRSEVIMEKHPILYLEVSRNALKNYDRSPEDLERLLSKIGYRFFVNKFDRNGSHDVFRVGSVSHITRGHMFDVLCLHQSSEICRVMDRVSQTVNFRDLLLNAARYAKRQLGLKSRRSFKQLG